MGVGSNAAFIVMVERARSRAQNHDIVSRAQCGTERSGVPPTSGIRAQQLAGLVSRVFFCKKTSRMGKGADREAVREGALSASRVLGETPSPDRPPQAGEGEESCVPRDDLPPWKRPYWCPRLAARSVVMR